jgi:hypothetical protein
VVKLVRLKRLHDERSAICVHELDLVTLAIAVHKDHCAHITDYQAMGRQIFKQRCGIEFLEQIS